MARVDGQEHRLWYSMSSSPVLDDDLQITVKRSRDGVVSNRPDNTAAPGITPAHSLLRSVPETTDRVPGSASRTIHVVYD